MAKGQFGGKGKAKKEAAKVLKRKAEAAEESSEGESVLDESEDEEGAVAMDGLSSVISKIVNQNTSKDLPVLEKRKVTNVQREASKEASEGGQAPQAMKKKSKTSQEVAELTPEGIQAEQARALAALTKERNLKKIATKGVIALFNAIMESKRRAEGDDETVESGRPDTNSSDKHAVNAEVKNLTKSKFLELIAGNEEGSSKKQSAAADEEQQQKADASSSKGDKKRGWGVLADDDDDGKHQADLKLRDWDKSSDEGEE